MAVLLLTLRFFAQEEHPIPRAQKDQYTKAIATYEQAARLLETDPAGAAALLDPILNNADIKKRDCRLKVETHPGTYEKYEFYPHQCRGRARMKLALGAERDKARGHLEAAIRDFEDSKRHGLAASDDYLREARRRLEDLGKGETPKPDPEFLFQEEWLRLLKDRKFRSAQEHVDKNGAFLTAEKRRRYVEETRQGWEKVLQGAVHDFLTTLRRIRSVGDLAELPPDPSRDFEPLAPTKELEWCATVRATFEELRRGEDALADLWDRAIEALAVFPEGESRGFQCLEQVAYDGVASRVEAWVQEARKVGSRDRLPQAEALRDRWASFEDRVKKDSGARKDLPERNRPAALAEFLARFPVDDASAAEVAAELERCVLADDPEEALRTLERTLEKLLERWDGLTLASRREMWTHRATAAALRGLLEEKSVEQIVGELGDGVARARAIGGPSAVPRYGPKVERLLQALR